MSFLDGIFRKRPSSRAAAVAGLPKSFYVGQPYVEDPKRVPAEIQLHFVSPGMTQRSEIDTGKRRVRLDQRGPLLTVSFDEHLSEKLLIDIKTKHQGDRWMLGYVAEVMPYVNQELLRQRYLTGHFFIRTYSSLDIFQLWVQRKDTGKKIQVAWPVSLGAHPHVVTLASRYDRVYLRDLIDSIHSYFNGEYEECVRKSITSIDTFIRYHQLSERKSKYTTDFEETIRKHLNGIVCPMMRANAADVIMEAYGVRNQIVHEGRRLIPEEGKDLGKRVSHMVNEVYKNYGSEDDLKRYAYYIEGQFVMQEDYLVEDGLSLTWLEEHEHEK